MVVDDVITVLVGLGLGTSGSTIFNNGLPIDPLQAMSVQEYAGSQFTRTLGNVGVRTEMPRVQILSRAATAVLARGRLETAYLGLAAVLNQSINGVLYYRLEPLAQPAFLKFEGDKKAPIYSLNLEAEKDRS